MTSTSSLPVRLTPKHLEEGGSKVSTPFEILLEDNTLLQMNQLLRVLPRRRYVGAANLGPDKVLAKLFVSSAAKRHFERELSGIQALESAGIDTPELIKYGATVGGGYHVLTEFLTEAVPFSQIWQPLSSLPFDSPLVLTQLQRIFTMLGQLHRSGLTHSDLHMDNLLVLDSRLLLIDGDAVNGKTGSARPSTETEANLAELIAQFPVDIEAVLDDLFDTYHQTHSAAPRPTVDSMRLAIDQARQARWTDYLRKLKRNCSSFVAHQSWQRRCVVLRSQQHRVHHIIEAPDDWLAQGEALKLGNSATVVRLQSDDTSLIIKRYNIKSLTHALSRALRPTRAWHAWVEGHRLERLGIPTALPYAVIESRLGPLRSKSWLIMENIPGNNLLQSLDSTGQTLPPPALAQAIVTLFRNLHRLQITHGDLKATNLIWHDEKLYLIDLDATTKHKHAKSFVRAWRKDKARLLRNWPEKSPLNTWLEKVLP